MWKYIKVVFKCAPYVLFSYFAWMLKYSKHPEKYDIKLRFFKVQKLIRKVLKAFRVNVSECNLEQFNSVNPEDPSRLLICNHLSDADPLVFIAYSKRPITFVSKKEVQKFPLVGRIVKILGGKFIDRDDLKMQLKIFKNIEEEMKNNKGIDWVIFPEGTRNKEHIEEVQEFHYGTFKPAMRNNLDIYVFSIFGTQRVLNGKCHNKSYFVPLKLNKVITAEDYKEFSSIEVSNLAREYCQEGLKEIIEKDKELYVKFSKKK